MKDNSVNLYCVYDDVAKMVTNPFQCMNDDDALRSFIETVRAKTVNVANTFPESKYLVRICEYDLSDGSVKPKYKRLACAKTYVVEPLPLEEENKKLREEVEFFKIELSNLKKSESI